MVQLLLASFRLEVGFFPLQNSLIIDDIDYVTVIGNSSREQYSHVYVRTHSNVQGQSVSHLTTAYPLKKIAYSVESCEP